MAGVTVRLGSGVDNFAKFIRSSQSTQCTQINCVGGSRSLISGPTRCSPLSFVPSIFRLVSKIQIASLSPRYLFINQSFVKDFLMAIYTL